MKSETTERDRNLGPRGRLHSTLKFATAEIKRKKSIEIYVPNNGVTNILRCELHSQKIFILQHVRKEKKKRRDE